jgi:hypothetical protein
MQNGQNLSQLLLKLLMKFGGKVRKIFLAQPLSLGKISYRFISFMNEIFDFAQISQLPTNNQYNIQNSVLNSYTQNYCRFA